MRFGATCTQIRALVRTKHEAEQFTAGQHRQTGRAKLGNNYMMRHEKRGEYDVMKEQRQDWREHLMDHGKPSCTDSVRLRA